MTIYKWTKQAIDCYNIGCWCSKCSVKSTLPRCQMKKTVIELVKNLGRPELNLAETKQSQFDIDEIRQLIQEGHTLKEVAKKYDVSLTTLRSFTTSHCLNGWRINEIRKKGRNK